MGRYNHTIEISYIVHLLHYKEQREASIFLTPGVRNCTDPGMHMQVNGGRSRDAYTICLLCKKVLKLEYYDL